MSSPTAELVVAPRIPHRETNWANRVVLATALTLLWLEVVRHLKPEWSFNPQYSYGWTVPLLAIFLLWQRWPFRPEPSFPVSDKFPIILIFVFGFLLFPIRFVAEANPDWRLLSWALAVSAVTICFCVLFIAGGRAWVHYFAFPLLFFLVAVPWPVQFEQVVIQSLMRCVTAINVTLLNIFGVPALQHGNVIEVSSGLIGIEEACSGVRSIQATLMVSLFLGELYSFSIPRRTLLVIAGGLLAFASNLVRTAILVWVGAKRGPSAVESWHDPAGLTILMVCLFGLWLLSLWMRNDSRIPVSRVVIHRKTNFDKVLMPVSIGLVAWIVLFEVAISFWYQAHQSPLAASRWTVQWPSSQNSYQAVAVAPEAKEMLHYDEGGGVSWNDSEQHRWMMYFFRWLPGHTAAFFVKIHRPDICLPAAGMTLQQSYGMRFVAAKQISLPVRSYRFDDRGVPLHVFYCYWDGRSSYDNAAVAAQEDWSFGGRIRAALRGRREIGAQMLEMLVWGYADDAEAIPALQRQLEQIVNPG
jgi:exosortase